jgi:hypothetical protein
MKFLKEVEYKKEKDNGKEYNFEHCHSCGGKLYYTNIPCPDLKEGCLVLHFGWKCEDCGKIYQ